MKLAKINGNKTVRISNIGQQEFFGLLKCNIKMLLVFIGTDGKMLPKSYKIGDRLSEFNKQKITVNEKSVNYDTLITEISNIQKTEGVLNIDIDIIEFKKKESLIAIVGSIKPAIVSGCVVIDYDGIKYSIIFNTLPSGRSDAMYYFDSNDSILAFDDNGPMLIFDNQKINGIEDVICN